jgi:hypothetical protein
MSGRVRVRARERARERESWLLSVCVCVCVCATRISLSARRCSSSRLAARRSFKDKKLVADASDQSGWGVRVASVRRSNPLVALMEHASFDEDDLREEDVRGSPKSKSSSKPSIVLI